MPKSAMQAFVNPYQNMSYENPLGLNQNGLYNQFSNFGNQPIQQSQAPIRTSHTTPMANWSGGFNNNYSNMMAANQPMAQGQGGLWDQFKGWANRPMNLTPEQYAKMDSDQLIKAGGLKTNLQNAFDLGSVGTGIASGLYGLYAQHQNQKQNKKIMGMQERRIASDEANKSAFARNAGAVYNPA